MMRCREYRFTSSLVSVGRSSATVGAPPATDGMMLTVSLAATGVCSFCRYLMSSSFTYTLTKLRSLPCSLYRCAFRPECLRVKSASSSPTVAPVASTASCLSVYGLSGVGMRIFAMMQTALLEVRSIVFQIPDGHVACRARRHGHDHVREGRPRVIEVVLRRPRRVIGMRVIKPEQHAADLPRPALRLAIIGGPYQKPPARTFLGG